MGKNHHSDQRHVLMSTKNASTSRTHVKMCYLFHLFYVVQQSNINIYLVTLTLSTNVRLAMLHIYIGSCFVNVFALHKFNERANWDCY